MRAKYVLAVLAGLAVAPIPRAAGTLEVGADVTKIAFAACFNGFGSPACTATMGQIYVINADGTGRLQLTDTAGHNTTPSLSQDASKIAFTSSRDGNLEIYVMNADGSGQINLTNNAASDEYPSFGADGSRIAFASRRDGNWEIYIMTPDGAAQLRLTSNAADDRYPTYSPDGSKIAFVSDRDGNWEVYVMNADGSGQTRLTDSSTEDDAPAFSPDGSKIAFASTRDASWEIYVMNADGSGQTRLTDNTRFNRFPAFSPGGSMIAYESHNGAITGGGANSDIYVMNVDGTGQTPLTSSVGLDRDPSFPLPQSTTVAPDSFSLIRGFLTAGGLGDLFASDDLRLDVRAGLTLFLGESPLQVVVTGTSPLEVPSELRFILEASVNTPGLTQTIELFNYDTSSYEEVDFGIAGAMDTIVEVAITTNPERFVQAGTREMRAKVAIRQIGLTLLWPWSASVDQAVWTIVP